MFEVIRINCIIIYNDNSIINNNNNNNNNIINNNNNNNNNIINNDNNDNNNNDYLKGRKKPFTSAKGEAGEEDRHIAEQPLTFGKNVYNLRTLNNLPYQRLHAGDLDMIKRECLANYEFLLTKLHAVPLM